MADAWQRLAPQLRALPSYEALLRSHELPTLIVAALDATPRPDDRELRAIVATLERMVANRWAFPAPTRAQQRLLEYAHDWASETLLALVGDRDPAEDAALAGMEHALFGLRAHSPRDALEHAEAALDRVAVDAEPTSSLLEASARSVHDDAAFVRWVERLAVGGTAVGSSACWQRLLARADEDQERPPETTGQRLFDALSLRTRMALWASDVGRWLQQLDDWLVEVHAAPFRAIPAILGVSKAECAHVDGSVASHLHVALVSWATRPSRRRWMRGSRSRALVAAVARLVRRPDMDVDALGLQLPRKVPSVLLAPTATSRWTRPQRAHVLKCVAANLAASPPSKRQWWLEFVGLIQRREIVQSALDSLIATASDVRATEGGDALTILAWHECGVYGVREDNDRASIEAALHETATGLGGAASWRDAVAWLKLHRSSSFATCTLTRLRVTWRWLTRACTEEEAVVLSDALESVEYALRRFAPADDLRRFQVEVIAVFLEDLEWVCREHRAESITISSQQLQTVGTWLQKLVRLLPPTEVAAGNVSLSQQVEERLDGVVKGA